MALPIKKNIPINTSNTIPNVNNLSDEATKLSQLVNKLNRSNAGQNNFTSTSSGITYNTLSYPTEPLIFNKGETGLYNLLIKLCGGKEGFLITADDWNLINGEITIVNDNIKSQINNTIKYVDSNITIVNDNIKSQIKASELQPLLDNKQYRPCVRITGYVDVLGFATTGKSDAQQIKEWIIKVALYYGANILIDVLFQADALHRLSGYMYLAANYGAIEETSVYSITHYYRRDGQWFDN